MGYRVVFSEFSFVLRIITYHIFPGLNLVLVSDLIVKIITYQISPGLYMGYRVVLSEFSFCT